MATTEEKVITGTVKWWDPRKGIGYIETPEGDAFCHFSNIKEGHMRVVLVDGEDVTLTVREGKKGLEACNVNVVKKAKKDTDESSDE